MKRPRLDLTDAKARILCQLHDAVATNKKVNTEIGPLSTRLKLIFDFTKLAADELNDERLCEVITEYTWDENPFTGEAERNEHTVVRITRAGVKVVEGWDDQYYSDVARKLSYMPEVGNGNDDKESESTIFAPASDRIVTLEHNSEQHREIVGAVDAVIEAVKGDNEYGNSYPEEKDVTMAALAAGRKLLDSAKIRVVAIKASLLPVLKFLAETFAKETVKGLATKAIAVLLKLIGMA